MACNNNEYFVGNGDLLIRKIADECGAASESFIKLGDANELMITQTPSFGDHFESQTGNRVRAARWIQNRTVDFTLSVQNFSLQNLERLLLGTDSGAVVAGSVVDEAVTVPGTGWVFVDYQGITAVTVASTGSPTALVLDTDYTVDSRNGGINILQIDNVVGSAITVSYTHVGIEGLIEAFQSNTQDYEMRFHGINLNAPNKPVIVKLHRTQFSGTEELSLIGEDITNLTFTGAVLPDGSGNFYNVQKANTVS